MSPRLPVVTGADCIRALERAGFFIAHHRGSHAQLRHQEKTQLRVTVPYIQHDLPRKTLQSILRQAELSVADFADLL